MAYIHQRTTFAQIAALYENTAPVREAKGVGTVRDLRPVGDRNRKWERIHKISKNCYVLSCDWGYSGTHTAGPGDMESEADFIKLAPIVWRKHKDGSATVTVRNSSTHRADWSRCKFISQMLPHGLGFISRGVAHYIRCAGEDVYLAKSRTLPAGHYIVMHDANKEVWTTRDDGVSITFRQAAGETAFSYVSGGKPTPKAPKLRVDTKAKQAMKDSIATFRDWAFAMYPMLPQNDYQYQHGLRSDIKAYIRSTHGTEIRIWNVVDGLSGLKNGKVARDLIRDEEHPMRLPIMFFIMTAVMYNVSSRGPVRTDAQNKAAFNRSINKACGFLRAVKG